MGPIPPEFAGVDGELAIGGARVSELIALAGATPLFVYDLAIVRARLARLRAALPAGVAVRYAIKANPFPPLLTAMAPLVDGFDVASAGEPPERISCAGPGKGDDELAAAIDAGAVVNLESEGEAERALAIAGASGTRPRLAVRVNPDFMLRSAGMRMGGGPAPFGIDAERAPALVRRLIAAGADWHGLHVFAGSQSLDAAALAATHAATLALASRIAAEVGAALPALTIGAGYGVPYFAGDAALDVETAAEALDPTALPGTRLALELGRWLVAEAGVYLARVVDRKESRGRTFLVVDGGMHHQLAASGNLGAVVRRNYPVAIASRFGAPPQESVSVVGRLCTPLDRLADDVTLPRGDVNDVVAVFLAGGYGFTASPSAFLGHPLPSELLIDGPSRRLS